MRVERAHVKNFRGLRDVEIDFRRTTTGEVRPVTVLVGDNGSGKTSVLQAIALTLGTATRKVVDATKFAWHGFLPERMGTLGPTEVTLEVGLQPIESATTKALGEVWSRAGSLQSPDFLGLALKQVRPRDHWTLSWKSGGIDTAEGSGGEAWMSGRWLANQLRAQGALANAKEAYERTGDVFWFDERRSVSHAGEGGVISDAANLRDFLEK
jgi:energy-coupling factor transporter ATP-binding protein EcfA2